MNETERENYLEKTKSLSEKEIEKIERVSNAIEKRYEAEARKESQQKLRVLFERAPKETLPFLVYCIYVAAAGLTGFIYLISNFKETALYILLGVLIVILILPILILPKLHFKKFFSWMFKTKKSPNSPLAEFSAKENKLM